MATVSLQRAVADLPATRARCGGGDAEPRSPGQPQAGRRGLPARALCAQRGAARTACASKVSPPLQTPPKPTGSRLKTPSRARQVSPRRPPPPRGRAPAGRGRALSPGAPGSHAARSTCEPFVFPAAGRCLRAAPGARRPLRSPPERRVKTCWRRQEREPACTRTELLQRQDAIATPSPRRQRRAPGRGQDGEGPTPRPV